MTALCVNCCGLVKLKVSFPKQQHNILPLEVYCSPNADPWCLLYLEPYFSAQFTFTAAFSLDLQEILREKRSVANLIHPYNSQRPTHIPSQAAMMTPRTNL